jgi:hypothetical protein
MRPAPTTAQRRVNMRLKPRTKCAHCCANRIGVPCNDHEQQVDPQRCGTPGWRARSTSARLGAAIAGCRGQRAMRCARSLIGLQSAQGFWLFELEADCTIPAEYIMMMHFLDEIDVVLQEKIFGLPAPPPGRARRLAAVSGRRASTSAAPSRPTTRLKLAGDEVPQPHMVRAREAILRAAARRAPMCSRASRWRCSARCRGAPCPTSRSRSCCCRSGFRSTSTRSRTGRAR